MLGQAVTMFRSQSRRRSVVHLLAPGTSLSAAVVAIFHLACTGQIGSEHGMGQPSHTGSVTTGGASGGSGTSGVGGTGGGLPPGPLDPGRVPLRRLNRAEYCNTVHDLLGTNQRPCDQFPNDNAIFGFDTIAEVQSLSSLQVGLYEEAATALVDEVMNLPTSDARRSSIVTCDPTVGADPKPCVLQILKGFATRAYRRPVTDDELTGYVGLLDVAKAQMGTVDDGLRLGLRAVLLSPHFLFRVELDPNPASPDLHPISDYELASRVSYSVWSSMPDAALLVAAANGTLHDPATLAAQVSRMLQDPKSHAITTDFIGQWLNLRALPSDAVDPMDFPTFDEALRTSMETETNLFFDDFLRQSSPATDILTANFTYLNNRLATHYGIPGPTGSDFMRVSLDGTPRRGILMQGSVLTVTSYPNRTSPVARGVWVLSRMLCSQPSPPPPNVPKLPETPPGAMPDQTMRERLAAHRTQPQCGACHNTIDPIGLGLEDFDGIGRYRTMDAGKTIDSSGMLPDGTKFAGAAELADILKQPARGFQTCMTHEMLTYMVGRGFEDAMGQAWTQQISDLATADGSSFGAIVTNIVKSAPFTQRRGETP
jgi:hypothetical protein